MLETTSEVRSTSNTAALASSTTALAYLFIVLFIAAVAIGVGVACISFGFSGPPLSLDTVPVTPKEQWPENNHSGWCRPSQPDHAELVAMEQRQLECARLRRGWRPISRALSSLFDMRTHRRLPADIALAHDDYPSISFQPECSVLELQSILGHSGWSRPSLSDHADSRAAALEQRQLDAARARRGWRPISRALSSRFDKRTHRRLPADIAPAHDECPSVLIQPKTAPELQRLHVLLFALSGECLKVLSAIVTRRGLI